MSKVLSGLGETKVSKKGMECSCVRSLLCKLNVLVNGVDVIQALVAVFYLLDGKGVIHIPKPQPRWMGGWVDALDFKLFHEKFCHSRADRGFRGCPISLFIILTLEEKIGVFKEELQQYYDVLY